MVIPYGADGDAEGDAFACSAPRTADLASSRSGVRRRAAAALPSIARSCSRSSGSRNSTTTDDSCSFEQVVDRGEQDLDALARRALRRVGEPVGLDHARLRGLANSRQIAPSAMASTMPMTG